MQQQSDPEGYKERLAALENDLVESIAIELKRINRPVLMEELGNLKSIEGINVFIKAIKLDDDGNVVVDISMADLNEKLLLSFFSDNEFPHWQAIDLLEQLKQIP